MSNLYSLGTHPLRFDHLLVIDGPSVHLDDRVHLDNGPIFDERRVSFSSPQNRLGRLTDAAQHEHVRRVTRGCDRARERRGVEYPAGI